VILADKYDAMVMVDECHAAGFIGATSKGTPEAKGVMGRVDIITHFWKLWEERWEVIQQLKRNN
jgi:7-keto-8-aminopelargonate synthetase-like enzyme